MYLTPLCQQDRYWLLYIKVDSIGLSIAADLWPHTFLFLTKTKWISTILREFHYGTLNIWTRRCHHRCQPVKRCVCAIDANVVAVNSGFRGWDSLGFPNEIVKIFSCRPFDVYGFNRAEWWRWYRQGIFAFRKCVVVMIDRFGRKIRVYGRSSKHRIWRLSKYERQNRCRQENG